MIGFFTKGTVFVPLFTQIIHPIWHFYREGELENIFLKGGKKAVSY